MKFSLVLLCIGLLALACAVVLFWLSRRDRFVPLTDLVPGLEDAEPEDDEVTFNESVIANGEESIRLNRDLLFPHPTEHCAHSGPASRDRPHGYRLAVKRRDMRYLRCALCMALGR